MKWNCFDWFDHYAAEKNGVPKLEISRFIPMQFGNGCRNKLVCSAAEAESHAHD